MIERDGRNVAITTMISNGGRERRPRIMLKHEIEGIRWRFRGRIRLLKLRFIGEGQHTIV